MGSVTKVKGDSMADDKLKKLKIELREVTATIKNAIAERDRQAARIPKLEKRKADIEAKIAAL